ncbi:hypothetical protein NIES2104_66280 [Leptolyngbya sp. NIES-2104]|nr:hypothetical protein NIES2104_66280 [Leptolyngbya sp. NIES-2104]
MLPQAAVQRAISQMIAINSLDDFRQFYDLFNCRTQPQRDQILDRFTAETDHDQQGRFYEFWQQFESPEEVEADLPQESIQATVGAAKWVYARLAGDSCETLVKVLDEKSGSLNVHFPGSGGKSIKHSDVIRVSDYTGD